MKKPMMITLMMLLSVSLVTATFAEMYQKSLGVTYKVIAGSVISVDKAKNWFVIKDNETGKRTYVKADPDTIASLNEGQSIRVTLPQSGNLALKIVK